MRIAAEGRAPVDMANRSGLLISEISRIAIPASTSAT
jgi:filamentous hemagglutinin family protein